MKEFLTNLLQKIIGKPDDLKVDCDEENGIFVITINVNQEDCGRIIGKKGKTINALKTLLYLYIYKNEPSQNQHHKIVLHVNPD